MNWLYILLILFQIPHPAITAEGPAAPGVCYQQNDGQCIQLQAAVVDEVKAKGIELFNYTGGYTNFSIRVFYRGAKSPLRIVVPKPTFLVRTVGSSKDVALVRLSQKGSLRTFQTSPSDATVENKRGFKKKDILKIDVTESPGYYFSLTPVADLKSGEYLIVFSSAMPGYDFGIDLKEK
jgi:hypothetical protein